MKNRRAFLTVLTAVSGTAIGAEMAAKRTARAAAGAVTPVPTSTPRSPSAAALAVAATFRAFDPHLSDSELHAIAGGIDDNRTGTVLNPKKKPLRNSDEMVARFAAAESL